MKNLLVSYSEILWWFHSTCQYYSPSLFRFLLWKTWYYPILCNKFYYSVNLRPTMNTYTLKIISVSLSIHWSPEGKQERYFLFTFRIIRDLVGIVKKLYVHLFMPLRVQVQILRSEVIKEFVSLLHLRRFKTIFFYYSITRHLRLRCLYRSFPGLICNCGSNYY